MLLASCSSFVPVASLDAGNRNDSGAQDGGFDAGVDAGLDPLVDAGCGATDAVQVAFSSAPQTITARTCSAGLKVQLQNACGAPVSSQSDLPLAFAASVASTEFFGDPACIGKPALFAIPAGANNLEVYFLDSAPGNTLVSVNATGLDGGSQSQTIVCAAGEKACNASACIPVADCCTNADCTAPKLCNAAGQCKVPGCSAFVNGCTTFIAYDGGSIAIGAPFNPKCVRVNLNTSVRFSNSGIVHPLEQTCGPNQASPNTFGSTVTVTGLSSFGTYGFRCASHPNFEIGAIQTP